jgi:hypothetical protein
VRPRISSIVRAVALSLGLLTVGLLAWTALFPGQPLVVAGIAVGYPGGGVGGTGLGLPPAGSGGPVMTSLYLVLAGLVVLGLTWVTLARARRDQ